MSKRITTKQASDLLGTTPQAIIAKINKGEFTGSSLCECGKSYMIDVKDVTSKMEEVKKKLERKDKIRNKTIKELKI